MENAMYYHGGSKEIPLYGNSMILLKSDTIHLSISLYGGISLHIVKLTLVECDMLSQIQIFFFEKPHPIQ